MFQKEKTDPRSEEQEVPRAEEVKSLTVRFFDCFYWVFRRFSMVFSGFFYNLSLVFRCVLWLPVSLFVA